jgi:HSP20 family molecular chaperone IbpA
MFDALMNTTHMRPRTFARSYNIEKHEDHYDIIVPMPAANKENINVTLEGRVLMIECESTLNEATHFGYDKFSQTFKVDEGTTHKKIKAEYNNGVLSVRVDHVDTKEQPVAKQIPIL